MKTADKLVSYSEVENVSAVYFSCYLSRRSVHAAFFKVILVGIEHGKIACGETVYSVQASKDENDTTDYSRINKLTVSRADIDYCPRELRLRSAAR